jgi:hypothetical protein
MRSFGAQTLLERKGDVGLDAVRAESEAKGQAAGLRLAVLDRCEVLALAMTPEQRAPIEAMGLSELEALRSTLKQTKRWPGSVAFAGPGADCRRAGGFVLRPFKCRFAGPSCVSSRTVLLRRETSTSACSVGELASTATGSFIFKRPTTRRSS